MDAASRKERNVSPAKQISHKLDPTEISMRCGTADELLEARTITAAGEEEREQQSNNGAKARPKLIPVLFFDESHKVRIFLNSFLDPTYLSDIPGIAACFD